VTNDSRLVSSGVIFIAYDGVTHDGHQFIPTAIERGAEVLVVERRGARPYGVPALLVHDARRALSQLAALSSGYAIHNYKTVGITGTNGKTTSLWLISRALELLGERVLEIGTLGIQFEGEILSRGEATTPPPDEIHRAAEWAKTLGATSCVMEVSSHALDQRRADDVQFSAALFTNLTPDHLNYHSSLETYFLAKRRLFEIALEADSNTPLAIGVDDEYGRRLANWAAPRSSCIRTFGHHDSASARFQSMELSASGIQGSFLFNGESHAFSTPLIGEYNARNFLGVFCTLVGMGYGATEVLEVLASIGSPSGRMERFSAQEKTVFVDYAHTADAMENALRALRPVTKGKLWVMFGLGGGKDPRRRSAMGAVAKELADKVVLTSDNPRQEDPDSIIQDILLSGVQPEFIENDRGKAIAKVVPLLRPGDILLLAGKGHENFQIVQGDTFYFSDQEEVQRALEKGQATE
jgi:UDP-N-acetylmuramoyl-L-alanyl-D-glutamate--2,6-diaminopimelate ligase